jgi:hypothetical protein
MAEVNRDAPGNGPLTLLRIFSQWANVLCALIFFASFGTSKGLYRYYRDAFCTFAGRFGMKRKPAQSSKPSTTTEVSTVVFTTVVSRDEGCLESTEVDSNEE